MFDLKCKVFRLSPFAALELYANQGLSVDEMTRSGRCTCTSIHLDLCLSSVLFELLMCHGEPLMYKVWQTHTCVDTLHCLWYVLSSTL